MTDTMFPEIDLPAWGRRRAALLQKPHLYRVTAAFVALTTLVPSDREFVAEAVIQAADYPLPSFLGARDEAQWWAALASEGERNAYAAEAIKAMGPALRRHFLYWAESLT